MAYHVLQGTLYEILCECTYYEVPISHTATNTICFHYLYPSYIRFIMICFFFILIITSVFKWSVKAYRALCFPLKVGRSAMAYFGLLHSRYDTEAVLLYFF